MMENTTNKTLVESFLAHKGEVRFGQMFGHPAYYVGNSMFGCLYEGHIGLKIPEQVANEARKLKSISDFQPKGKKKMREWVQFKLDSSKDLEAHSKLIESAIRYASQNFIKKQEGK